MKILPSLFLSITFIAVNACTVGANGARVSTGQTYFSPYAPTMENTAVVYIYWNQSDIERYIPFGQSKPEWNTFVNRKKNAELEEGSYSVVEVEAGRVAINARPRISANSQLSNRDPQIGLSAKAGETYYIKAQLVQGTLGLELQFEREISEREAYQYLYGLRYQKNLQESMVY
jgi:hypothetical protein